MDNQVLSNSSNADAAIQKTVLYDKHIAITSRMAPFAGYMMPLWYSSIRQEHEAVRQRAGLFDVTHMGVLEIAGADAKDFLNLVATNDVNNLQVGQAQYSYILDKDGKVLDDIIVYNRGKTYMVVVNASNEAKIRGYFEQLLAKTALINNDDPQARCTYRPSIIDLRNPGNMQGKVDIALQGPKSLDVLCELVTDTKQQNQLKALKGFWFTECTIDGIDVLVAKTGYTGAKIAYELFVHPHSAIKLWDKILSQGPKHGVEPCGLGSRDSLRIEAGLPLYGHELEGDSNISPFEAGYGWAVKLDKPFFIGKKAMVENASSYQMEIARLKLPGQKGVRPVRPGDAILTAQGICIGHITSCAGVCEEQVALALIKRGTTAGFEIGVCYAARNPAQLQQGRKEHIEINEQAQPDLNGMVAARFERF